MVHYIVYNVRGKDLLHGDADILHDWQLLCGDVPYDILYVGGRAICYNRCGRKCAMSYTICGKGYTIWYIIWVQRLTI